MRSFCQIHVSEYADQDANCRDCDVQREMETETNVWRDRARAAENRLRRAAKYAVEDRMVTPGSTRLARLLLAGSCPKCGGGIAEGVCIGFGGGTGGCSGKPRWDAVPGDEGQR